MKKQLCSEDWMLFDINQYASEHPSAISKKIKGHVWTERKAQLIARYLKAFTYITKHGTYIDAFAGPQTGSNYDNWAAKLVLENQPKWLRRFHLFDFDAQQIKSLNDLKSQHHEESELKSSRKITVHHGDSNLLVPDFLESNPITEKEATFCLLDQRTKECKWSLVENIARHKQSGNKIEIFYFLAQGWIDRVLTNKLGDGNLENVVAWLGDGDWEQYKKLDTDGRAKFFLNKFSNNLGYKSTKAYPIYEKGASGKIIFWMIHACDHPRAPQLMDAAYSGIGMAIPEGEQFKQLGLI